MVMWAKLWFSCVHCSVQDSYKQWDERQTGRAGRISDTVPRGGRTQGKLEGARESAYLAKWSDLNITTVKCRSFHRKAPPFLPVVYDMWRWWWVVVYIHGHTDGQNDQSVNLLPSFTLAEIINTAALATILITDYLLWVN